MGQVHYGAQNSAGPGGGDYNIFAKYPGGNQERISPDPYNNPELIIPGKIMDDPAALLCPNPELWLPHKATVIMPHWQGGAVEIPNWTVLILGAIMNEEDGTIHKALILWGGIRENQYSISKRSLGEISFNRETGRSAQEELSVLLGSKYVVPGPKLRDEGLSVIEIPRLPIS